MFFGGRDAAVHDRRARSPILDSEFTEFFSKDPLDPALFGPGGASVPDQDLSGNATAHVSEVERCGAPEYVVDLANGGTISLGSNFAYKSKQYHTEFNDDGWRRTATSCSTRTSCTRTPDGHVQSQCLVKNLTDELVYAGSFSVSTSRAIGGTLMPPRTFGVTAGIRVLIGLSSRHEKRSQPDNASGAIG
jgi:iron complex outermembrane receptor protein